MSENTQRILVEIKHHDNAVSIGYVFLSEEETLYQHFNKGLAFIELEIFSGEHIFIALPDIKAFKECDTQNDSVYNIWSFDPYKVMDVPQDIDKEALQAEYNKILQMIHPDIIENHHLHPAFKAIARDLTRRIISAFEFIHSEIYIQ